jgi:hypothetical protein
VNTIKECIASNKGNSERPSVIDNILSEVFPLITKEQKLLDIYWDLSGKQFVFKCIPNKGLLIPNRSSQDENNSGSRDDRFSELFLCMRPLLKVNFQRYRINKKIPSFGGDCIFVPRTGFEPVSPP